MAYSAPPPGPARRRRTETNHQPHCPSCLARHPQSFHTSARRRTAYRSPEHPRLAGRCGISLKCRMECAAAAHIYAAADMLINWLAQRGCTSAETVLPPGRVWGGTKTEYAPLCRWQVRRMRAEQVRLLCAASPVTCCGRSCGGVGPLVGLPALAGSTKTTTIEM